MRPRVYTTPVIVLRRTNLGEHDKILKLFTLDRGKLSAVAKGARKPVSRLAGATELFTHSRVQLAVGRNLDVVTQAEVAESFRGIRADLRLIGYASLVTELVDCFTLERDAHQALFWLLLETLRALDQTNHPDLVTQCFQLHLLSDVGYRPQLEKCLACGDEVNHPEACFSPSLGGVLCRMHRLCAADAIEAPAQSLSLGRALLRVAPSREEVLAALAKHVDSDTRRGLEELLRRHAQYRLERPLRSPDFVRTVGFLGV